MINFNLYLFPCGCCTIAADSFTLNFPTLLCALSTPIVFNSAAISWQLKRLKLATEKKNDCNKI